MTRAATDGKFARLQQRLRRFGGEHCSMAQEAGPEAGGQRSLSGCLQPQPAQLCLHCGDENSPGARPPSSDKAELWQGGPLHPQHGPRLGHYHPWAAKLLHPQGSSSFPPTP